MKTLTLTTKDFDKNNNYNGKVDLSKKFDGDIEIAGNLGWVKFKSLWVTGSITAKAGTGITAGSYIEAGEGIEAGTGITAGSYIKAGWGIEAGWGITAGLSIKCKGVLKFGYRLFAGTAPWRDMDDEDKLVECAHLEGGTVCYGAVRQLGLPSQTTTTIRDMTIDGQEYEIHPVKKVA